MKIGCPTEIKPQEFRVGLTPHAAREAVAHGHDVLIETGAGVGSGFADADYTAVGARIITTAEELFASADLIIKVKEPQPAERKRLRAGQVLFTYLHLAPDPEQTRDLLASGVTAIAYETVTDDRGGLPLLAPMSEVAGRLAPQVGAWTLQKANGGRGVLLGGVPGVLPAKVVVIGGGVVGTHAGRIAAGMGADVTVLDRSLNRLRYLDDVFGRDFRSVYASAGNTADLVADADMVIGAVLIPGAAAPKLVSRAQLSSMKPGAAIVDVAIDQGGCFETYLDDVFGRDFKSVYASAGNTADLVADADMVIGAVLIPGAAAPKLVSRAQLSSMKPGAAIVDVAIDQGGCFETSHATTHQDPIYAVDGIMHYCVANMPGAVARTSTQALGNATLPFLLALADKGWKRACEEDTHLMAGLNTHAGHLTYFAVGRALGLDVLAPALAMKK